MITNATMQSDQSRKILHTYSRGRTAYETRFESLHLSMRGYHKSIKVARTIADLANSTIITVCLI